MKITWIGQAGLLIETNGKTILIDPYLSDSVKEVQPQNYRRVPVDESLFDVRPDVIVITHCHLDHFDKQTLDHFLGEDKSCLVLAPNGTWQEIRKYGGGTNYVLFNSGTQWSEGDVRFIAVKAEHSDEFAIGVIICAEGKNYYVTGDTLYSEQVFESLPNLDIEALFLPVNGVGNNMNMQDAVRFSQRVAPRYTVPMHFGMFDSTSVADIACDGMTPPTIYKEIVLE